MYIYSYGVKAVATTKKTFTDVHTTNPRADLVIPPASPLRPTSSLHSRPQLVLTSIARFRDERWMALDGIYALGNLAAMSRACKRALLEDGGLDAELGIMEHFLQDQELQIESIWAV